MREEVPRSFGFEGACWDCQHIVHMKDGSELGIGGFCESEICEALASGPIYLLDWRGLVNLLELAAIAGLETVAEQDEVEDLVIDVGAAGAFNNRSMFDHETGGRR